MTFPEYARHGWVLVPIKPGTQQPDAGKWSDRRCCITRPETAGALQSAGLAHAYSGTCSIDVDNFEAASQWLSAQGVDLKALLEAPDAVRITSGREGRAKLIYALDDPLPTTVPVRGLELRCGSRRGTTVQDVLPPSIHPKTGEPYRWLYNDELIADWRSLPALPAELHALWQSLLVPQVATAGPAGDEDPDDLAHLLEGLDPNAGYDEWIRVGMALHHATDGSEAGLDLWDEWSAASEKYRGRGDLVSHWRSFVTDDNALVTADWLRSQQGADPDDFDLLGDDDPWTAPSDSDLALQAQFQFVQASEWADRPARPWLVQDVLPQADLAMIYGESGSGKSFFALDLACAIAGGLPWRGEHLVAQGNVAWIAAEAAGSMRDRLRAAAQGYGYALDSMPLYITGECPNLADISHVRALAEASRAVDPRMIVVDTLAAASGGVNENSGEDMSVILAACRVLHKATGALVVLVHHAGKDKAKGARGWSGLKAAMETEIEVSHEIGRTIRTARVVKQRDGADGAILPFRLQGVSVGVFDADDEERTSCFVAPVDHQPAEPETDKLDAGAAEGAVKASIAPGNGWTPVDDVLSGAVLQFDEPVDGLRDFRTPAVDRAAARLLDADGLEAGADGVRLTEAGIL